MTKHTKVIRVGQAHLLHLPEEAIEEAQLGDEVVVEATEGAIIIRAAAGEAIKNPGLARLAGRAELNRTTREPVRFLNSWEAEEWDWK